MIDSVVGRLATLNQQSQLHITHKVRKTFTVYFLDDYWGRCNLLFYNTVVWFKCTQDNSRRSELISKQNILRLLTIHTAEIAVNKIHRNTVYLYNGKRFCNQSGIFTSTVFQKNLNFTVCAEFSYYHKSWRMEWSLMCKLKFPFRYCKTKRTEINADTTYVFLVWFYSEECL